MANPLDPSGAEGEPRRRRKLAAIMMVDVSGFSRLMGSDEEATVDRIRDFHRRVQALVERFEGRVVDTAGDSVFGEFDSVVNAVSCAWEIQQGQALANEGQGAPPMRTRIGVHLGDVIVEDYRVYGDGVNIAARLEPLADPGGICFSEAVYQQIRNKLDLSVEDLGLRALKNIEHPLRVYRVRPPVEAKSAVPVAERSREHALAPRARSWVDEALSPANLVPTVVGLFLLASPLVLFSAAGTFPTGGAILLGIVVGKVYGRITGRAGSLLVFLGLGIASGAVFTDWSRVTNALFVLAGLIVSAIGAGQARRRR